MPENWKEHPTLEITVSNIGRIRKRDGRIFHQTIRGDYPGITIGNTTYLTHLLVWETFRGERERGFVVDHIDEDKYNPELLNLQQIPQSDNVTRSMDADKKLAHGRAIGARYSPNYAEYGDLF